MVRAGCAQMHNTFFCDFCARRPVATYNFQMNWIERRHGPKKQHAATIWLCRLCEKAVGKKKQTCECGETWLYTGQVSWVLWLLKKSGCQSSHKVLSAKTENKCDCTVRTCGFSQAIFNIFPWWSKQVQTLLWAKIGVHPRSHDEPIRFFLSCWKLLESLGVDQSSDEQLWPFPLCNVHTCATSFSWKAPGEVWGSSPLHWAAVMRWCRSVDVCVFFWGSSIGHQQSCFAGSTYIGDTQQCIKCRFYMCTVGGES